MTNIIALLMAIIYSLFPNSSIVLNDWNDLIDTEEYVYEQEEIEWIDIIESDDYVYKEDVYNLIGNEYILEEEEIEMRSYYYWETDDEYDDFNFEETN